MYAILATFRDEAPFLLEWLAYHKVIGFDHVVIYSNDCSDGTERVLDELAAMGEIEHIPHTPSAQESVASQVARDAFTAGRFADDTWIIWLDADEFLNIHHGDGSVGALTEAIGERPGACLSWRIFGDGGKADAGNGFISEDFTGCAADGELWKNVKTLFRNGPHVVGYHQHKPVIDPAFWRDGQRFIGGTGVELASDDPLQKAWESGLPRGKIAESAAGWTLAQVNHYAVRTRRHFEAKASRGRIGESNASGKSRYTKRYFKDLNRNEASDSSILRWRDGVRARMADLGERLSPEARAIAFPQAAQSADDLYRRMHSAHHDEVDQRSYSNAKLAQAIFDVLRPERGIDVGCGIGLLMRALCALGTEMSGIEGPWLTEDAALCPFERYRFHDLEQSLDLGQRYDVAVSIEVAEHLEPGRAKGFVTDLCRLSDVVVFSAAIPGQGGKGHKNEQWQSYWAELFEEAGYGTFDVFRPALLRDPEVLAWHRQNVLLFAKPDASMANRLADFRIPPKAADMIVPEHHRKIVRRTRRHFRKKLDALQKS